MSIDDFGKGFPIDPFNSLLLYLCVKAVVCVHAMKACGRWGLRLVVSYRPAHFAAPEEVPRYSTNRKSGEPQTRSGRFVVEIHLLPFLGME
jgi:hypothetical protein